MSAAEREPKLLLTELLENEDISLSQLAQAIGYPYAALRAYRCDALQGDTVTAAHIDTRLRSLAALLRRMRAAGHPDPAVLLESWLVKGYTVRGWDLYRYGMTDALLAIAAGRPAEEVLDLVQPDWREQYWTDFEVFLASDGHLSIRRKDDAR